jgi:hypothetical protein
MDTTTRRLVPITVAARKLRVATKWLNAEAEAGRIPCLRAGNQILCEIEAVEAALLERARQPSPAGGEEQTGEEQTGEEQIGEEQPCE